MLKTKSQRGSYYSLLRFETRKHRTSLRNRQASHALQESAFVKFFKSKARSVGPMLMLSHLWKPLQGSVVGVS